MTQSEQLKNEKSEDSLRYLWDNIKWTNIHIIEKVTQNVFGEMMAESFP